VAGASVLSNLPRRGPRVRAAARPVATRNPGRSRRGAGV